MLLPRIAVGIISIGLLMLGAGVVSGQSYPNKPIRVLTTGVGGVADVILRLIAPGISASLGQPLIIENRVGNPGEIVASAPADGYTILVNSNAPWNAMTVRNVSYDPLKEFSPISFLTKYPTIVVVPPSFAAKSVQELIAIAKSQPGKLNYGSSGVGTSAHLGMELFKKMAGVDIVHVPYKGGAPALVGLTGGEVQVSFTTAGLPLASLIKAGKFRALAVTSAQPSPLYPELPTVAASGVPGFEVIGFNSVVAPVKTPAVIITRLHQEFVRALNRAEVREMIFSGGAEPVTGSPGEVAAAIKTESTKWKKLIKETGIKAD